MEILTTQSNYQSPVRPVSWYARFFPTVTFYSRLLPMVFHASGLGKKQQFTRASLIEHSLKIVRLFESLGIRFEIENLAAFQNLKTPCVFIGNHMSTLETFVLPGIISPFRQVAFVVKESLIKMPVFKHIILNCEPIVVGRTNPRGDFAAVLEGGGARLHQNISIIVFPQTTRGLNFDPKKFNSIGVKLARQAEVPVIPVALKTDAWGLGRWSKDFGKIQPTQSVHFAFGNPVFIQGNGKAEHEQILTFIQEKLKTWCPEAGGTK